MVVRSRPNKLNVNAANSRVFDCLFSRYISMMLCFSSAVLACATVEANADNMVQIPRGYYTPLFKTETGLTIIEVDSFYIDQYPVTNKQFDMFIKKHTEWNKENIKPIFSDSNYLKHFSDNGMQAIAEKPVTNVSWFAARAYCRSINKRLPTTSEWEYVAKASRELADASKQPAYRQQILDWYSRPASDILPDVNETEPNYWKVYAMHGVIWELVSDFNTALVTGESRGDTQLDKQLFCGAGAASSLDPNDYAAFMRYAMRSSYSAHYTIESLGFRCARDNVGE